MRGPWLLLMSSMVLACSSSSFEPVTTGDGSTTGNDSSTDAAEESAVVDTGLADLIPMDTGPTTDSFSFPTSPATFQTKDQTAERALPTKIVTVHSGSGVAHVTSPNCSSMHVAVEVDGTRVSTFTIPAGSGATTQSWSFDKLKLVSTTIGSHLIRYVALDSLSSPSCLGDAAHVTDGTVSLVGDL